ncbi:10115_t:CDS:2, partial [Scutellospora calospora]
ARILSANDSPNTKPMTTNNLTERINKLVEGQCVGTQLVNHFIKRLYSITLTQDNIIKETSSQLVFEAATERDLFWLAKIPTQRTLNISTSKIHDAKPQNQLVLQIDNDLMLLDDKLELLAAFELDQTLLYNLGEQLNLLSLSIQNQE